MTGPVYGYTPNDVAARYSASGGWDRMEYANPQDMAELNLMTLIGCVEQRGEAWHKRDDLQGAEDNHYPGHIPVGDVLRRLFNWHPRRAEVAYLVPAPELQVGDDAETPVVWLDGSRYRVVKTQEGRWGVLRDDNDYDLGVFKSGAEHPPYQVTLIEEAERLTGTTLGISTAGLLRKGAVAWVEYSMTEALHDGKSGLDYRPNLLKADSMDGSMGLTTALTVEATVCMNTLTWNLLEAKEAGRLLKRKHTRGIGTRRLDDERAVLGILERVDEEFISELHALLAQPVTDKQVIDVLDIIKPVPDEDGRAKTLATNWRDAWMAAYESDPMANTWKGTAFGVVQADNTFRHHYDPRRGGDTKRWEANTWRAIQGKTAEADREVAKALELVLA